MSASSSLGQGRRHPQLQPHITWLGTGNVRGINRTVVKGGGNVFRKGKFKLLALTETKLKGNGGVSWREVNGIIASFQEMERARKGGSILLNDVWHSAVIDFGCIKSRILWIFFKFLWWWGMVPMKEWRRKGEVLERL